MGASPSKKLDFYAGKHVLITGGSEGLGLSIAKLAAERGARVTLVARTLKKLEAARDAVEHVGDAGGCLGARLDKQHAFSGGVRGALLGAHRAPLVPRKVGLVGDQAEHEAALLLPDVALQLRDPVLGLAERLGRRDYSSRCE